MKQNLFKNIDANNKKKTIQISENERESVQKTKIVTNIYDYVKVRIEMGIFKPFELTDVYNLDVYVGISVPKDLNVLLNGKEICLKEGDYLVFDFNNNISHITKDNFSSFYRFSKVSPYQQLLSAIQLFKITTNPDEIFVKENYNESIRQTEDVVFGRLTEMIMNGNVDEEYIEAYKQIMEEKYKNKLINYTILSNFKAKYFCKKLKKKKVPFALICPLVESIIEADEGDFDVDNVIKRNNYLAMVLTADSRILTTMSCLAQVNEELSTSKDLLNQSHSLDTLTLDELIAFKSQFEAAGIRIPGVTNDKIIEQMKQEAIEEAQTNQDDLSRDNADIFM